MQPPFVIFALPRSRTRWVSAFLTYAQWQCGHDELRHCRSLQDVQLWLSQPMTGTVETAGSPFWRLLLHYQPMARVATIRRPVADVMQSLVKAGVAIDPAILEHALRRYDRKLDQIEHRVPGVRSYSYQALQQEETCADLFEHCLPYQHDHDWWQGLNFLNVQTNLEHTHRYFSAYREPLEKLAKQARHRTLRALSRTSDPIDGVVFQVETMASFDEAIPLFREHLVLTDQSPDAYLQKNLPLLHTLEQFGALHIMSARSNGRLFGYLMSVVAPSLDAQDKLIATHTIFFASPAIRNLGMKLQRAAAQSLREQGVNEIQMRAGVRGAGPRLGAMYRRMGAEDFGQMYQLSLED